MVCCGLLWFVVVCCGFFQWSSILRRVSLGRCVVFCCVCCVVVCYLLLCVVLYVLFVVLFVVCLLFVVFYVVYCVLYCLLCVIFERIHYSGRLTLNPDRKRIGKNKEKQGCFSQLFSQNMSIC